MRDTGSSQVTPARTNDVTTMTVVVNVDASNREQVEQMMRMHAQRRVANIADRVRSLGKGDVFPDRLQVVATDILWRLAMFGASRNSGGMDFNTRDQTEAFLKHLVSYCWTKDELYGARSALHLAYGPWPWVAAEDQVLPASWL